jgi:sulfur transfer protein SufE
MTSDGGKGDTQRPTDHEAFSKAFDAIDWGRRVAELIDTTEELKLYPEQQKEEGK